MKRTKQLTAALLALSTVFSLTGCGEKQPYKERLAEYLSAFENKDADDLLELMNEDAFFDGMEEMFEDDEDFYACLGCKDAEDFAEVSLENWLDSLGEGEDFESFTYTVENSEKVEPESVKLPDHQKLDITAAYRVSLAFECEDDVTLEFLEDNLSELYAVQAEDEEWYFVNSAFEVTVDGAQEKLYGYLMSFKNEDEEQYLASFGQWHYDVIEELYTTLAEEYDKDLDALLEEEGYDSIAAMFDEEMVEGFHFEIEYNFGNDSDWSFTISAPKVLDEDEFAEQLDDLGLAEYGIEVEAEHPVLLQVGYENLDEDTYGTAPDEFLFGIIDGEWTMMNW